MPDYFKLSRGLTIRMKGAPENKEIKIALPTEFAIYPDEFKGLTPKSMLKPGDLVKAGTPVFYSKDHPEIKFASPVSGILKDVVRGERRKIEAFIFESDGRYESEVFEKKTIETLTREDILAKLTETCAWPFIRQRPYNIIAQPESTPRDIFISGFDSAPLAPDIELLIQESASYLQAGISVISKLTTGKIFIGLPQAKKGLSLFEKLNGVTVKYFSGPHPAGTLGVQIHHIAPLNKGEIVWTLQPEDVIFIGKLFAEGKYDVSKKIALAGSEFKNTGFVNTVTGASVVPFLENNISANDVRVISGHVLTGRSVGLKGHLGQYDRMVTVIPEGNHYEFLGWALPGFNKFSHTRTFFSWMFPGKKYRLHTNLNGGERALVMTGEYEKVVPMDILPQHLLKAIMIQDIELMEKLGIYEVTEEELALCDFVCTSKTEVQQIVGKGIELMIKEMS
ncbi:MAG: NADH:ubiquinone reductase (Na(+)-transporting) subunit A [Bacteroidetes bacterium HGW-Bacteroidetes-21]|nr:MAG: NADH:ubiquinone reductase (Na(+)-transporting) subunit A [Bacteroidetes bacterium HGW-Bacteroidetes-21]